MDAPLPAGTRSRGGLYAIVSLTAAAMLQVEVLLTRLFSVVFFYHYSFFAVSLVMAGLALGGILATRIGNADLARAMATMARLALAASILLLAAIGGLCSYHATSDTPKISHALLLAFGFAPALTLSGAILALVFSAGSASIGSLYAADLLAAGTACVLAIPLMRHVPGPSAMLVPALLLAGAAALAARGASRLVASALSLLLVAAVVASIVTQGRTLRLRIPHGFIERWNEHSLVRVMGTPEKPTSLVIDRTASTPVIESGPYQEGRVPQPGWAAGQRYIAYQLGRPIGSVAIIGVGGGRDVLGALAGASGEVDGYEINKSIVDLHQRELSRRAALTSWPRVHLICEEGRVGIRRSGKSYDLIQASMIDTWAATAGGGMVLSENALYTREAWQGFLRSLTPQGMLTVTRWYVARAPAEAQRLLALAAASLEDIGIQDARDHILLVVPEGIEKQDHGHVTIVVARSPFSRREARIARDICARGKLTRLVSPRTGVDGEAASADPVLEPLLVAGTRAQAIAASPYDISPPTDQKPYFFLQLRPWNALFGKSKAFVLEITFRAVELLSRLVLLSLGLAAIVLLVGISAAPRGAASRPVRRRYLLSNIYFFGIGFGYILVQLGLHQRLIVALGHPTRALALVLLSMLWGTGLGSFASARLFRTERSFPIAWLSVLAVLCGVAAAFPALASIETLKPDALRDAAAAGVVGIVGFVLGFGFPLGIRLAAPVGAWAVPRLWAVNGAASIAGSAFAAVLGMCFGSRVVIAAGIACYGIVAITGAATSRTALDAPAIAEAPAPLPS